MYFHNTYNSAVKLRVVFRISDLFIHSFIIVFIVIIIYYLLFAIEVHVAALPADLTLLVHSIQTHNLLLSWQALNSKSCR